MSGEIVEYDSVKADEGMFHLFKVSRGNTVHDIYPDHAVERIRTRE